MTPVSELQLESSDDAITDILNFYFVELTYDHFWKEGDEDSFPEQEQMLEDLYGKP